MCDPRLPFADRRQIEPHDRRPQNAVGVAMWRTEAPSDHMREGMG
jgi:hypothetical protein